MTAREAAVSALPFAIKALVIVLVAMVVWPFVVMSIATHLAEKEVRKLIAEQVAEYNRDGRDGVTDSIVVRVRWGEK